MLPARSPNDRRSDEDGNARNGDEEGEGVLPAVRDEGEDVDEDSGEDLREGGVELARLREERGKEMRRTPPGIETAMVWRLE